MQPEHMVYNQRQFLQQKWGWKKTKKSKWGVPKYHLKTTLSTFGGSIFSSTKLKANTKLETDVEQVRANSRWCVLHVFIHTLCLLRRRRLAWPNTTRGGLDKPSRAAVVEVENYGAVISTNYGAMMNLQQCLSQEMLTDDSSKRGAKVTKKHKQRQGYIVTLLRQSWEVDVN